MATPVMLAGRSSIVTFATRGGLGFTTPPAPPPASKKFGGYCFRATCEIFHESSQGCPVAKLKGYDTSPQIGKDTEEVCRIHAQRMDEGRGGYRCGEASVALLPNANMECSGQMMLVMDGSVKRLV
jgi:hypothetical protein